MRTLTLTLLFFTSIAFGENFVQITATKKVGQKDKGDRQSVGDVRGRLNSRAVYYDFNVRTVSPKVSRARAEWVVLTETLGMIMPAGHGERMLNLKLGHSVRWQSEPVNLKELEFKGIPDIGSGEIETAIKGYGIRLLDGSGRVIGEKYSSSRVKSQAQQMLTKMSTASTREGKSITLEELIKMLVEKAKALPVPPPPGNDSPPKIPGTPPKGLPKLPFE